MVEELNEDILGIPEKKPWRLKLIIGAVVVLAITILVTVATSFYLDTKAVDDHFEAGNKHYDKAFDELEDAFKILAEVKVGDGETSILKKQDTIILKVARARQQLRKAEVNFKLMNDKAFSSWEKKTALLMTQSVNSAERGVDALEKKIEELEKIKPLRANLQKTGESFNKGIVNINKAVTAANEDKFDEAASLVTTGTKSFADARTSIARAQDVTDDNALDEADTKVALAQQWAEGTKRMIAAGKSENFELYNDLARDNNELGEDVEEGARLEVLSQPLQWVKDRLNRRDKRIHEFFEAADKYRERALKVWDKNS